MKIYLDYNATSPLFPEAISAMQEVLSRPANPSSVHEFGRAAKKHLEDARGVLAETISSFPDEIIFTASGSEANNMAIAGVNTPSVFVSAVEHSSVLKAHDRTKRVPVDANGIIELQALELLLAAAAKPALVSVMLANNETGVIQPIAEIAALCKKHEALLHCDAVQALGKIPVDFGALGVDMLSLSAHKCGGPVGAGAFIARRGLPVAALIRGGGQEMNRRAGTENVAAIAGFAAALKKIDFAKMKTLRAWLDAMESDMLKHPGVEVFGKKTARLPNTSCVSMPGVSNEVQLMDFDLKGFAVSAGSACSSGRIEVSHVLSAMGASSERAGSAIRISGGWATTEIEIRQFLGAWDATCERLAKSVAA